MLNRWIEGGLLDTLEEVGAGCIAFSPLAQGMLTDRYLDGVPDGSRHGQGQLPQPSLSSPTQNLTHIRALNELAARRGQSLAQLALAWALRDPRVTSVADRREQRRASSSRTWPRWTTSTSPPTSSPRSTGHAVEGGINIWRESSSA